MGPQAKKILLVEDEKFIADLYARQLTNAGLTVTTAYDGISGFKFITTQQFDLVLLDIMLPGMNGLELLKEWKQKNPGSTLPVLLLTNLGQDAVIKEGFSLGAQGYLIKASYTPAQVVTEVQNALAGKQAGSPNPNMNFTNTPPGEMPTPAATPTQPAAAPAPAPIPTSSPPEPLATANPSAAVTPQQNPPLANSTTMPPTNNPLENSTTNPLKTN